jgi:hypothetical protein
MLGHAIKYMPELVIRSAVVRTLLASLSYHKHSAHLLFVDTK